MSEVEDIGTKMVEDDNSINSEFRGTRELPVDAILSEPVVKG